MKRYEIYCADFDDMGDELNKDERADGEWCKYSEVEAELAKKDEEVARLREALEWYRCNSLNGGEKAIEALERKSP